MGSSSSKPEYPFPVPAAYDPPVRKFSMMKRWSKKGKGREQYDDFIVPKFPTTTPYGFPYYQPAYPAYYAPVVFGVQQPVLAPYVPFTAYQTAPATQMPVPATAPIPVPPPAPPPQTTQMPEPHRPPTPVIADPVIPPPPMVRSDPRPRFTGFYRPADVPHPPPNAMPEPQHTGQMPYPTSMPEPHPIPPPSAGPAGRTPFATSMPTPMPPSPPMPMTTPHASNNPLPLPPADVWDTSPYRQVLANLPTDVSAMLDVQSASHTFAGTTEPPPRSSSRLGALFGSSSSSKDKGKRPLRGLFRSRSNSVHTDAGSSSGSRRGHARSHTMTSIVIPPSGLGATTTTAAGPPIEFDHTGGYAGFVNHSHHRVMYKNKVYPTALHLLEAMKFTHRPDLQERIRTCKDVNDMYPLSAGFQEHVRPDWGRVFLQTMEDVLYLKFKQHPDLRTLLLRTGLADIVYKDESTYWGKGLLGEGANELGKALVRVRERLRQEGER